MHGAQPPSPGQLRWAVTSAVFGLTAAIAPWAFEFGKGIAGLQAEAKVAPGQFRHQKLVMQSGQDLPEFADRHEVVAVGTLGGRRSWTPPMPGGARESRVRQCARVEGMVVHPPDAVIMGVQARLIDPKGAICVSQTVQW